MSVRPAVRQTGQWSLWKRSWLSWSSWSRTSRTRSARWGPTYWRGRRRCRRWWQGSTPEPDGVKIRFWIFSDGWKDLPLQQDTDFLSRCLWEVTKRTSRLVDVRFFSCSSFSVKNQPSYFFWKFAGLVTSVAKYFRRKVERSIDRIIFASFQVNFHWLASCKTARKHCCTLMDWSLAGTEMLSDQAVSSLPALPNHFPFLGVWISAPMSDVVVFFIWKHRQGIYVEQM